VPQGILLNRATAVVSHAGAGTLIGAAAAGRVQLNPPLSADQWENADLLAVTGASLTLETNERDAATIGAAVERLLADLAAHAAAQRVRADFAAMPHPRTAVAAIELQGTGTP